MSIFTSQTIKNSTKETVLKFTASFTDAVNEDTPTKIVASALGGALNSTGGLLSEGGTALPFYGYTIKRVWFNTNLTNSKYIDLYWNGSSPSSIMTINTIFGEYNIEASYPTISNNATVPTGDIGIRTYNVANGDFYTLILELRKDNNYYHAGQFFDPGAFNYQIDTEIITENENYIITESGVTITIPRKI
jgi:hypothetical protein